MGKIIISIGGGSNGSDDCNAISDDVLLGKTYLGFDTDDDVGEGTMPMNEGFETSLNPGTLYVIPRGFHTGDGVVSVPNLSEYTRTSCNANKIRSGKTAWANGELLVGTLTSLYW